MNPDPRQPDEYKQRVEQLAHSGRRFSEIEAVIDSARLTQEYKAALWLLAWSYETPGAQRGIARDTLAVVS